jgi:hypothetical protein
MINCGHDLCVDCAAETYVDQTQIKGQSKEVYYIPYRFTSAKSAETKIHLTIPASLNSSESIALS